MQLGCVVLPAIGALGVVGAVIIVTGLTVEVHKLLSVTVKLYVPAGGLFKVKVDVLPE